jgi:uncharacterized delta-60 repeat protein
MIKNFTFLSLLFLGVTGMLFSQTPGTLDTSFSLDGYHVEAINNMDGLQDIFVQDDQKIIGVGMSWDSQFIARAYAMRFLPNGDFDPDFGTDGIFIFELDFEAIIYKCIVDSEGRIVLAGATTDYNGYRLLILRLNSDGTLDDSFGDGGVVAQQVSTAPQFAEDFAFGLNIDSNDNILISGTSDSEDYIKMPIVVRFNSDGDLDTNFGVNGVATIPVGEGSSSFNDIEIQEDGKIIAAGYFGNTILWNVLLLTRFNEDGSLDTTFGEDGIVKYSYSDVTDEIENIVLKPDGNILVVGFAGSVTYNYNTLLGQFNADGSVDTAFGDDGFVSEDVANFDVADEVKLLADGSIIIGGTSGEGPPNSVQLAVWKYSADGSAYMDFGDEGFAQVQLPNLYGLGYAMDIQADEKILIGGQARATAGNANHFVFARLHNSTTISGLFDGVNNLEVQVYPNPSKASELISISLNQNEKRLSTIEWYSIAGLLVSKSNQFNDINKNQSITLSVPIDLNQGTYFLRLVFDDHSSSTAKIVLTY